MKFIGIKYCGGCNPVIDRTKLVQEIGKRLPQGFILSEGKTKVPWDTGILVCGCPTACAEKPELKALARRWMVVAGHSVDQNHTPEKELADIVITGLKQ